MGDSTDETERTDYVAGGRSEAGCHGILNGWNG
jgi:hypothetical protein